MARDGLTQGGVGDVHAQLLVHHVQHPVLHLDNIVLQGVIRILVRDIRVRHEEIGLVDALEKLNVLHAAVHLRAGVHAADAVQEIVAPLDGPLDQGAAVLTCVVRHVIRRHVDAARIRRAHPDREAVVYIEQHLGHVIAGVAEGEHAFLLSLAHQLVVGVLKQILKVD